MQTRRLGATEIELTEVTLGTWGIGAGAYATVDAEALESLLGAALDAGIRAIDLAPAWGEVEQRTGQWLKSITEDVAVITRAGTRFEDEGLDQAFDPKSLVISCDASLSRLGREAIDVWLLHNPTEEILMGREFVEVAEQLKQQGKVRAWGVSVGTLAEAKMAIAAGAEAICLAHNVLYSGLLEELAPELEASDCGVLARSPLMYGLLAGTWSEKKSFEDGDHRQHRWGPTTLRQRVRQVNALRFMVDDQVPSLLALAARFSLLSPHVASSITGARSSGQVREFAEAVKEARIPEEKLERLEQVLATVGA